MEKTDEQIAKERDAVLAMKNAQANMGKALERIATLEFRLKSASETIKRLKNFISPCVYEYRGEKTCHSTADEAVAEISKVLS